ncbi:MAG: hypothetical protein MZV64_00370 [Ignavibacteriales bacterium]|nr:hypothetical protein [Ignavibacteriales bacterium]
MGMGQAPCRGGPCLFSPFPHRGIPIRAADGEDSRTDEDLPGGHLPPELRCDLYHCLLGKLCHRGGITGACKARKVLHPLCAAVLPQHCRVLHRA